MNTIWLLALTVYLAYKWRKDNKTAKDMESAFEYWGQSQRDLSAAIKKQLTTLSNTAGTVDGAIVALHDTLADEVKKLNERIDIAQFVKPNALTKIDQWSRT